MGKPFRQKKILFALMVVVILLLLLLGGYIIIFTNLKNQTLNLSQSGQLDKDLTIWIEAINSMKIFPGSKNEAYQKNYILNTVDGYIGYVEDFNKFNLIQMPIIKMQDYKEKENILTQQNNDTDKNFFANEKYMGNLGAMTFSRNISFKLNIDGNVSELIDIEVVRNTTPEYRGKITGTLDYNSTITLINKTFLDMTVAIRAQNIAITRTLIKDNDIETTVKQIFAINNLTNKLQSLKYSSFEFLINDEQDIVNVGNLVLIQDNSTFTTKVGVIYDKNSKKYIFINPFDSFAQIPNPTIITSTPTSSNTSIQTLNCNDCFLAGVDKTHSLPSSYKPSVVNVSLSGGGQLTAGTITALSALFDDAKSKNIEITILSSYRSFQTQISTFNYWVDLQKKKA